MGSSWGKLPLLRSCCKWDENMKIKLTEMELGGMDWIDLADDRDEWQAFVSEVMNLRVP